MGGSQGSRGGLRGFLRNAGPGRDRPSDPADRAPYSSPTGMTHRLVEVVAVLGGVKGRLRRPLRGFALDPACGPLTAAGIGGSRRLRTLTTPKVLPMCPD